MALITPADAAATYPSVAARPDLAALVAAAEGNVLAHLGRAAIERTAGLQFAAIASGGPRVWLPEWPLISVEALTVRGQAWAPSRYELRAWGAIHARCGWPRGAEVLVTYTAGYAPGAPELARCRAAALLTFAALAGVMADGGKAGGTAVGPIVSVQHRDYSEQRAKGGSQALSERGLGVPPAALGYLKGLRREGVTGSASPR